MIDGPITPDQIGAAKRFVFPEFVFEAFNELIAANAVGGRATVKQKDVVELIISKANNHPSRFGEATVGRNEVYNYGWLNIEDAYRDAGWKVVYDKPGYNESYDASFEFTKK